VRGLRLRPDRAPIDIEVRGGELVGLAGLEGHGQDEFLTALWGGGGIGGAVIRHTAAGDVRIASPKHAADNGIAYVPRERRQALFGWMSIRENFAMPTLAADSKHGWLRPSSSRRRLEAYVDQLNIVLGDADDAITTLSGGNQQKVVIARWLAADPRVLLLNDPTRGIDAGAKRDLYALLTRLAEDGLSVVMVSSEVDEHVELMDRVLVFREQELFREIPRAELSRDSLVSAFFGESQDAPVTA
jgi:ABC-type sugar transport system ATPase subunit